MVGGIANHVDFSVLRDGFPGGAFALGDHAVDRRFHFKPLDKRHLPGSVNSRPSPGDVVEYNADNAFGDG